MDGQLTAIGRVMAKLPLDVRLTKLILLGHVFGLLDDCVHIGMLACLSSSPCASALRTTSCEHRVSHPHPHSRAFLH